MRALVFTPDPTRSGVGVLACPLEKSKKSPRRSPTKAHPNFLTQTYTSSTTPRTRNPVAFSKASPYNCNCPTARFSRRSVL